MSSKEPSGTKYDEGKPDLSLLPYSALSEIAKAMMVGEKKYCRYNYLAKLEAGRLIAACARHLFKWYQGEDVDPETDVNHLGHAGANIIMLLNLLATGNLVDDRYKPEIKD